MKTIDFFMASSAELKLERMELVDLLQDLSEETEERGIRLKPVLWEFMDSSMRAERKEDEYLERLRQCEICLVMFWRTLGEYTVEELDVAVAEKQAGRNPKLVLLLFKEPADDMSLELFAFKENYSKNCPNIPYRVFTNTKALREEVAQLLTSNL